MNFDEDIILFEGILIINNTINLNSSRVTLLYQADGNCFFKKIHMYTHGLSVYLF